MRSKREMKNGSRRPVVDEKIESIARINKPVNKKKGGKQEVDYDNEDWLEESENGDALSTVSKISMVPEDNKDDSDRISEAVENLSEKRPGLREMGLKVILKILRGNNPEIVETVLGYNETICTSLLRLLRKPASLKEGTLCLQAGPDERELFQQFEQIITKIVNGSTNYEELRVCAVAALAFSSFICSSEDGYKVMTLCEDIMCGESEGQPATSFLKARAAASWLLLASIMPESAVLFRCKDRVFDSVVGLIEDPDSDVKISAVLTLAALWEIADNALPEQDYTISGLEICENPAKIAQAVSLVKQAAKESSKRISKRDKKEQRAVFRDVEGWIVNGEQPFESVRMQGAVIECTTFTILRLLEELREVLGDGFHSSLKVFPVVKDVLGVTHITNDMDGDGKDSVVKKGGATDKLRSGYRKQERNYRDISREFSGIGDDDEEY